MFNNLKNLPPGAKYSMLQVGQEDSNGIPPIYLDGNALLKALIHAQTNLAQNLTGVFWGAKAFWNKKPYLEITGITESPFSAEICFNSPLGSLWELEGEKEILGWYCSQPGQGLNLSQEILANQQKNFPQSHNFLLLVDPVLRKYALWQWQEERLMVIPGFKITCLRKKKEQMRQLLWQSGFQYSGEEKAQPLQVPSSRLIRAYQPRKSYREVFLSKDLLVNKEFRSREEIEQIIKELLEELSQVTLKVICRLYWEVKPGEDHYYADHWVCELRWLGKVAKHSLIWNTELI